MENDFYETLTFIIDKDGPESVTNMIENTSCHPKKLTILKITILVSIFLAESCHWIFDGIYWFLLYPSIMMAVKFFGKLDEIQSNLMVKGFFHILQNNLVERRQIFTK